MPPATVVSEPPSPAAMPGKELPIEPLTDRPASNGSASPAASSAPAPEVKSELAAIAAPKAAAALTPPHFEVAYLNNPKPPYPAAARRFKLEGTVILRVMVKASGAPETVELARSSGASALDDAALIAVKGWRFVPARQGDTPIDHWVDVPMRFRLVDADDIRSQNSFT